MSVDASYPESMLSSRELREPRQVLEPARGTGLEHFARIRPREFRVLGLAPKSDVVAVTAKIKKKIAARGLTLEMARRAIEDWEYQRRSPSENRCVERYARIGGRWYLAVTYVPSKSEIHPHNSLATFHLEERRKMQARLESEKLYSREK